MICPSSLSIYNANEMKNEWGDILNKTSEEKFEIDMKYIKEIDAASIQILLSLKKECEKSKIRLIIRNCREEIKELLKLSGISTLLEQ